MRDVVALRIGEIDFEEVGISPQHIGNKLALVVLDAGPEELAHFGLCHARVRELEVLPIVRRPFYHTDELVKGQTDLEASLRPADQNDFVQIFNQ